MSELLGICWFHDLEWSTTLIILKNIRNVFEETFAFKKKENGTLFRNILFNKKYKMDCDF